MIKLRFCVGIFLLLFLLSDQVDGYQVSRDAVGQNPINELISRFFSQLDSHFQEKKASVIKVVDNNVYINIGRKHDVTPGMIFNIYRKGQEIPVTTGSSEDVYILTLINTMVVDLVQENVSSGTLSYVENPRSIPRIGDMVITKQPFLKIAFTYNTKKQEENNFLLQLLTDILSYRSEKTGRYLVYPTEKFNEALQQNESTGTWKQRIIQTAQWLNIDVLVSLYLSQTGWEIGLNGYLFSVKKQQLIDFLLATIPKNPQISSIINNFQKQEDQVQGTRNFISTIPRTVIQDVVLDATTYDVDDDGNSELFILTPSEIRMYSLFEGGFQKNLVLNFSEEFGTRGEQRVTVGKLVVADINNDGAVECYARSSRYSKGYTWILNADSVMFLDHFYGYPIGVEMTPAGKVLLLAKLLEGKDYFSGELFYQFPTDSGKRLLAYPDKVVNEFYNYCTLYDPLFNNLVRMFLDLDNQVHFMTSTGGAYIKDQFFGAAMVLSDIDLDHKPDFFMSSASLPREPDYFYMFELEENQLKLRWQSKPELGSIYVMTSGDVDGDGKIDLVVFREQKSSSLITTYMDVYSH